VFIWGSLSFYFRLTKLILFLDSITNIKMKRFIHNIRLQMCIITSKEAIGWTDGVYRQNNYGWK